MVKLFLATYGPANMAWFVGLLQSCSLTEKKHEEGDEFKKGVDMKLILYALLIKRQCGNED